MRRRRVLVLALFAGVLLGSQARGDAVELPFSPDVTYTLRSVHRSPAGDTVGTHAAVLAVPRPVDADGDAVPDLLAQLTIDAGRAHLRVGRLPTAPALLPVAIEAILRDPRAGSTLRVAFGYDALAATAPESFEGSLGFLSDGGRVGSFAADIATIGAGATLGVTAEVFSEGPDGARIDPVGARLDLTPVPAVTHLGVLLGSDLGSTTSRVDVAADTPARADVHGFDEQGTQRTTLDLTLDRLPNTMSVTLTETGSGRAVDYTASDRIDLVTARLRHEQAGATTDELAVRFEDMARRALFVQESPTHATFSADQPIGVVEAGFARGGSIETLDHPTAYLYVTDRSSNVRLLGLSAAEFDAGDPLVVDATLAPGPFRARVLRGARVIDATIEDLPAEVHVEFSAAEQELRYAGSSPAEQVVLTAHDPGGIAGPRATDLALTLEDLPEELEVGYSEHAGSVLLTACPDGLVADCADNVVGSLELIASDGAPPVLPPVSDGVTLVDTPSSYGIAARLTGLKRIALETATTPYRIEIDKAPGTFAITLARGARDTAIDIAELPASVRATFDPTGSLSFTGSAPIEQITASIADPAGVGGRAKRASVVLRQLPTSLALSWNAATGRIDADARGATVGLLEFLLTSGPTESLPSDRDGLILRDLTDRYVVFGRVTGLRKASAILEPPDVSLDTTGGRILRVDLNRWNGSKTVYTRATLDRLTPSMRVRVVETSAKREILYTASARTNSLVVDTNSGDRANLHAEAANPLPASLTFCSAENLACTPSLDRGGRSEADAGSARLVASEHTTVNMLDCVRPLTNCSLSNASEYTTVQNLRVRSMTFDADSNEPVGYSGHIYLDTDNFELTGFVKNIKGSGGFSASFPGGLRAQNRLGKWAAWGLSKTKTGAITCPGGTSLDVRVFGIWIGVTGYLC